jgi:hypothetical protein
MQIKDGSLFSRSRVKGPNQEGKDGYPEFRRSIGADHPTERESKAKLNISRWPIRAASFGRCQSLASQMSESLRILKLARNR